MLPFPLWPFLSQTSGTTVMQRANISHCNQSSSPFALCLWTHILGDCNEKCQPNSSVGEACSQWLSTILRMSQYGREMFGLHIYVWRRSSHKKAIRKSTILSTTQYSNLHGHHKTSTVLKWQGWKRFIHIRWNEFLRQWIQEAAWEC